jgi:protein-S-isoprenylcysteine O-methyltransferase Ste14
VKEVSMSVAFTALRALVFAGAFLWLWTWVAASVRPLDARLGGSLAAWAAWPGALALALGAGLTLWCIGAFVLRGRGTPAVFDAPRRLVITGPYRYCRNPMYVGGALLLAGFGLVNRSPAILLLTAPWWLLFLAVAVFYEEPALRARFGPQYEEYCRAVPRWIPGGARRH